MLKKAFIQSMRALLVFSLWACGSEEPAAPSPYSQPQSISGLRRVQLHEGLAFGPTAFKGVVISDAAGKNMEPGLVAVQEEGKDAGILVQFPAETSISFRQGEEVSIDLSGARLEIRDGDRVVTGIPVSAVKPTGRTVDLNPKSASLSDIAVNAPYWGPILVKVSKLSFAGGLDGKFQGEVELLDGIRSLHATFLDNTLFADLEMPTLANSFTGIVRMAGDKIYLNPRNPADIIAGVIETVEDFELVANSSYDVKDLAFKTGTWTLDGAITAGTSADPKNGAQSIRVQGTVGNDKRKGLVTMNFDVKGVKKLKVSHGIYPASAELANVNPTTIDVEISRDGGLSYTLLQQLTVDVQTRTLTTDVVAVPGPLTDNVRFRLVNSSTPFSNKNKPRLNIDDVVFQY